MPASPRGRFVCGAHKRATKVEGRYFCLSEKCEAEADSFNELEQLPHEAKQNHQPKKGPVETEKPRGVPSKKGRNVYVYCQ